MSNVSGPRCVFVVNGKTIEAMEASVHVSRRQSADTFFAKLPLDNDAGLDETFWSDTAPIPIEVRGTNDISKGGFKTLLTGQVDKVQVTLHDRIVTLIGRDKTALLTDSSTSEQFLNQSVEDVVQTLATRAGLIAQFLGTDDGDSAKAGLQYDQDVNLITTTDNYWNTIVGLARQSGQIAFVKGNTVFVQPIDAPGNGTFTVTYQRPSPGSPASSNSIMLTCARDLNIAKTVLVEHQTWNQKQGKSTTSKFQSKSKSNSAAKDTAIMRFHGANMSKSQQDRVAKSRLKETMIHEREVDIEMPGDVTIDPQSELELTGTGTKFDQSYLISGVVHRFDINGGYQMTVSIHNKDADRGDPEQIQ